MSFVSPVRSRFRPPSFLLPQAQPGRRGGGRWQQLIAPLLELAASDSRLRYRELGEFQHGAESFALPRFALRGPAGGGDLLRLGVFAAIHGDEPAGAWAVRRLIEDYLAAPERFTGYELLLYPLCNPSGFEDGTRHSRAGADLNREFWRGSLQPEIYLLERELGVHQFHGLIALHADDTSDGAYAFVRGATLTEALAVPALAAAARHLPVATRAVIDGFAAERGIIRGDCYAGVLSDPRELQPAPFEIIFETPGLVEESAQVDATVAAVHAILEEYRALQSIAAGI
ncbi:MAG: succinylglutamate desuccinylase/aspartoacylase family protein [Verrucomicrobia bacterium]|nr:succinylglutamate desuccinylase/aspartoacylase family protein [Verrucomicrobiota bacterium]